MPESFENGYDLYVFRNGRWQLHASYDIQDLEKARSDTNNLKDSGEFVGVCLVWPKNKEIIHSHNSRGDVLTFDMVTSGRKVRKNNNLGQLLAYEGVSPAKGVRTERKENDHSGAYATGIIVLGIFLAGGIFKVASMVGIPAGISLVAVVAVAGLALVTAVMVYAHTHKQHSESPKDMTPQKLGKCNKILSPLLRDGKDHCWLEQENKMSRDSPFGLILFLGGAAQRLSGHFHLEEKDVHETLTGLMSVIGMTPDVALRCLQNLDEYMLYPRYNKIIEAGKNAITRLITDASADPGVEEALDEWLHKPRKIEEKEQKAAAVLFTDIVNFTYQTRTNGDDWMKAVLHAHNDIVRTALKSYKGREVKHTGDGIMASFPTAPQAVNAAISMQKGFLKFCKAMPDRAFGTRIGMSAGVPVHIDGDLFGTPVNLAARVMPFGEDGAITVSQAVYDLCCAGPYEFNEIPNCELKGFDGVHSVYQVGYEGQPENCARPETKTEENPEALEAPDKQEEDDAMEDSSTESETGSGEVLTEKPEEQKVPHLLKSVKPL